MSRSSYAGGRHTGRSEKALASSGSGVAGAWGANGAKYANTGPRERLMKEIACAARATEGVVDEAVGKRNASGHELPAHSWHRPERVPPLVVGEDQQDARLAVRLLRSGPTRAGLLFAPTAAHQLRRERPNSED